MNPTDRFKPPGWALRTAGGSTMALADMAGRTPCSEIFCAKSAMQNFMTIALDAGTCLETPSKNWRRKRWGQFFVIRPCPFFFWFRSTGSRPHGPCASPRGSAARPRRGAPPRSMAPKLLKSRRRAPKAPPAGHVFVAGAMHDGHASGGHFTPHRKKN